MNLLRFAGPAALALFAAAATGCAGLDRESYSLAFRKKEHQYQEPAPAPELSGRKDVSPRPEPPPEYLNLDVGLQPFRPFAYCYRHESAHVIESLVALPAAPIEYSLALTVNTGSLVTQRTLQEIGRILGLRDLPPGAEPAPREGDPRELLR